MEEEGGQGRRVNACQLRGVAKQRSGQMIFQKHISLLMFDFQNVFGLTCKIYLSQISKSIFLLFLKAYLLLYRYIALSEFRELIQSSTIIMAQLSSREGPRMWRI